MAKLGIIQDEEDNFRFVLKKLKVNFTKQFCFNWYDPTWSY